MSIFSAMSISATGMTAQRVRMDVISQNLANVNTTRADDGSTYRRQTVVMEAQTSREFASALNQALGLTGTGVKVTHIVEDMSDLTMVYEPTHPDADENGYVHYPNVNSVTEMTNLIDASRAYEANVSAFNAAKTMAMKGLELLN
ncbi:MAG: flagellar basal body rod protein FlgC [Lachnospiraceae bacterium]|nr:flagellar basal body rod protein FlgC [Lachnospiraceae bacterium]